MAKKEGFSLSRCDHMVLMVCGDILCRLTQSPRTDWISSLVDSGVFK